MRNGRDRQNAEWQNENSGGGGASVTGRAEADSAAGVKQNGSELSLLLRPKAAILDVAARDGGGDNMAAGRRGFGTTGSG